MENGSNGRPSSSGDTVKTFSAFHVSVTVPAESLVVGAGVEPTSYCFAGSLRTVEMARLTVMVGWTLRHNRDQLFYTKSIP